MKKCICVLLVLFVLLQTAAFPVSAAGNEGADEYDTGITFDQLSRTPDQYIGSKVKFTGTVLQVLEGDDENQGRLSLAGSASDIVYFGYDPALLDVRLLEDDEITIYGESYGLWTYTSIFGKEITLPCIWADKIEFAAGETPGGAFDEEEVLSQLEVTELHLKQYSDYDFLVVKNNSDFDLAIKVEIRYYDADGKLVDMDSRKENAVEAGYPIVFWLMPDEYDRMEYTFSVERETTYAPVASDLTYVEESVTENKLFLSVTNEGTLAAEFVEGTVLFYKGDTLVDFDYSYFTDDDYEIKPGDTITKQFRSDEAFESYEVYFTGWR